VSTSQKSRAGSVVILAAGHGKRMKSAKPKVLHPVCGRPLIAWVLDQALALEPERIVVVIGHGGAEVEKAVRELGHGDRVRFVRQEPQLGTGHALQVCLPELGANPGVTVVLYGDMPCLRPETLLALVATQAESAANGMAILTAMPAEPRGFGRILRNEKDAVIGIVEDRDASAEQKLIDEVNLGVYAFDGQGLVAALPKLSNKNAQGEYYLTDVLAAFVAERRAVEAVLLEDEDEGLGVNTLAHLAEARWALQLRILETHLENGVYIEDPASTYIDHGVEIGAGTRILPCTVIRAGAKVGRDCEVGPFAQLRVGAVLEDGAEIGNFVEVKNTRVGSHAKAKHLAYLGDGDIGARSNIGAGTIFANYDGVKKHKTKLGERVFVGSGSVIVAPNTIGDGATTGAGAIVTRDSNVGAGEVWVGVPAKKLAGKSASSARSATGAGESSPGARKSLPGDGKSQPGAVPSQPGAGPSQPGAVPSQPGAVPSQPGAGPSLPGAGPFQPGAGPSQPGAGPSQPGAGPSLPGAGPSDPGAGPSLPRSAPFQPGSEPSQPGAGPSDPGAAPSQPRAGPSLPRSAPSQPGSAPSQPGAGPSLPGAAPSLPGAGQSETERRS